MDEIEECDVWWFRELYSVLAAFADEPENSISRLGATISIPEDQAEDLDHFRGCILAKYPGTAELAVMKVVGEIHAILDRKRLGGECFEEFFWTNQGFQDHAEWTRIRALARSFLLH